MPYVPKEIGEVRTPVKLLKAKDTTYNGVTRYTYEDNNDIIYVNWKTYGGTETTINGVISIADTAQVVTWYRPDVLAKDRLQLENGKIYEIISEPENIDNCNCYLKFKVERVKGGA